MAKKEKGKDKKEEKGKGTKNIKKVVATEIKSVSRIRPCSCPHEFQDKEYGRGMRLHNTCKGTAAGSIAYRCTVCGVKKGG